MRPCGGEYFPAAGDREIQHAVGVIANPVVDAWSRYSVVVLQYRIERDTVVFFR